MAITTKPRGNLSKAVVLELVKDATPEQVATLFTGKDNKPCTLVSRKRAVEVLSLTGAKKKAVEDFVYPPKAEKPVDEMTANQLTNAIKALNDKISKLQAEKKVFKDALDKKLK